MPSPEGGYERNRRGSFGTTRPSRTFGTFRLKVPSRVSQVTVAVAFRQRFRPLSLLRLGADFWCDTASMTKSGTISAIARTGSSAALAVSTRLSASSFGLDSAFGHPCISSFRGSWTTSTEPAASGLCRPKLPLRSGRPGIERDMLQFLQGLKRLSSKRIQVS
jgi:hypothetical protein